MLRAAQEEMPAPCAPPMVGSDEQIFPLAAGVAVAFALETHTGENTARGKKPHQGIFPKNLTIAVGATWVKWSKTHWDSGPWRAETVLGPTIYGYDGHGSVRQLTNTAGVVTDTYDYDAFGNLSNSTGSTANNYLFAGEQYDPALGLYYNRARYLNTTTGRFWSMDTFEGDLESPASLHKYTYAVGNPIDGLDPSGNDSLGEISFSFAINTTIQAMPVSAVIRAGQLLYRVAHGVDLSEAAQGAAIGFLQDSALTFLSAGLLRYAVGTLPLRAAGTAVLRAANSVWATAGNFARGEAVERYVFQNILGYARSLPWTFPVIDDFVQGTATSIKSLDLTAASYQSGGQVLSALSKAAGDLAEFAGRRWGGAVVDGTQIQQRVLIVAIEDGAATVDQELALKQFLQNYQSLWPNIKVAIETIP